MSYNIKLMVKVSNLYYKDSLTQEEVSEKLKISKYQVNRILKKAISSGIVQINIIDPTINISNLEVELEKKFGLKRAIVVENYGLSDIELKSKLGNAAANFLIEIIKGGDIIGVSWGTTINTVIDQLPSKINKEVEVVQITGGSHQLSVDLNCHDITRRLAKKFNAEPKLLYAPAILDSKELHKLLLQEKSIKETFEFFDRVTVALVGIGAMYPKIVSTLVKTGHINEEDFKSLKEHNAVGDVFSHFFNIDGKICDSSLKGRLVAMPVEVLLKVPYSIGVAGGRVKAEAILGALRGRYINILITDNTAAEKILKLSVRDT
jgi:DNA-binding transcriptional regulator LsrR (DeoR family)